MDLDAGRSARAEKSVSCRELSIKVRIFPHPLTHLAEAPKPDDDDDIRDVGADRGEHGLHTRTQERRDG